MGAAFVWGAVAASSLLVGALVALGASISDRALGLIMGFGAGVLISAVAYELVEEAAHTSGGQGGVAVGLFLGALAYFVGDELIDRMPTGDRSDKTGPASSRAMALALVLGIVLDGIPESIVLGLTVLGGGVSVAMLGAVFISNVPEAIAATAELREGGWAVGRVLGLWVGITVVCGIAALLGYAALDSASPRTVAVVTAFAGGAILTMLADTMMPEAFEKGGPLVGLCTTAGFALAFALSEYA